MEGTIGEIRLFAGNFSPKNWAYCQGQMISVQSNTALFAILGTMYGGNGTSTFQLPNTIGSVVIGAGQGPGLSLYNIGESGGSTNVTLTVAELPMHIHAATYQQGISGNITLNAATTGDTSDPNNAVIASDGSTSHYIGSGPTVAMATGSASMGGFTVPAPTNISIGSAGGSTPHNNMQPYMGMNYIICMFGYFPSRN